MRMKFAKNSKKMTVIVPAVLKKLLTQSVCVKSSENPKKACVTVDFTSEITGHNGEKIIYYVKRPAHVRRQIGGSDGTTLADIWFCPLADDAAHTISKKSFISVIERTNLYGYQY